MTARGALYGGYTGLLPAVLLIILGPNIWVEVMGFEKAIFPYAYPTIISMGASFLFCWYFSVTDKSERARQEQEAFPTQLLRSQTGK